MQSSFWDSLPLWPGVYIFEDENKKPLYIGKSISLKTRIHQHYEGFEKGTSKAQVFIPQTKYIYFKTVKNDLEAVITEANYIKSYQPRYNSQAKDGKTNIYIVFTNQPSVKIKIIHATDIDTLNLDDYQKQVFGPYTSEKTAKELLKIIRKIFGFCLLPYNNNLRPCFNYHLQCCPGACVTSISQTKYNHHLGKIKKFLSGHFNQLNKDLYKNINRAIKKQEYEVAEKIRRSILSLDQLTNNKNSSMLLSLSSATDQIQSMIVSRLGHPLLKNTPSRIECYDLAHLQGDSYVGSMAVFVNGNPDPSKYRKFHVQKRDLSDPYAMRQIIKRRLNHPEWGTPDLIVLDGGVPQLSIVTPEIPANIPVIALAKRKETIYYYDNQSFKKLTLNIEDPVLNLLRSIRDEAHRLATSFHASDRRNKLLKI